jgi:hypothetical protein
MGIYSVQDNNFPIFKIAGNNTLKFGNEYLLISDHV